MDKRITRRSVGTLLGSAMAGLAVAPLEVAFAHGRACHHPSRPYGPLTPKLPSNAAELPAELQSAFVALPEDFSYSIVSFRDQLMRDGQRVPDKPDGMAAFRARCGGTLLVRNHELTGSGTPVVAPDATYDPQVGGGTTSVHVDEHGRLLSQWGSLAGTERNCAGGPTPWGTWLSCEETTNVRDGVRHGYVFEVDSRADGNAQPLTRLGRFKHEAAAVDRTSGAVYLTEDQVDGSLYRFVPTRYGDLHGKGQLQALRLRDWRSGVSTGSGFLGMLGQPLAADWVDIEEYDPADDSVRAQAQSQGAASFSRGEGCWYDDGRIHFTCTSGGELGSGQVFTYDTKRQLLSLTFESTDASLLKAPDNITVGADGTLYLCEDGGGHDRILALEDDGSLSVLAQNVEGGSEWAGVCFAPAGDLMFANMQGNGLTVAIRGPWCKRGRRDRMREWSRGRHRG